MIESSYGDKIRRTNARFFDAPVGHGDHYLWTANPDGMGQMVYVIRYSIECGATDRAYWQSLWYNPDADRDLIEYEGVLQNRS